MRIVRTLALVFVLSVIATAAAEAAPVTFTLLTVANQTIQAIQIESGSILLNGAKVGEYVNVRTSASVNATINSGAATLTLLFDTGTFNPATAITLQGSFNRSTLSQIGSISASSISALIGVIRVDGGSKALTLQIP
jgi:PBP1b-binding outer membrane lipoprotein LpoB